MTEKSITKPDKPKDHQLFVDSLDSDILNEKSSVATGSIEEKLLLGVVKGFTASYMKRYEPEIMSDSKNLYEAVKALQSPSIYFPIRQNVLSNALAITTTNKHFLSKDSYGNNILQNKKLNLILELAEGFNEKLLKLTPSVLRVLTLFEVWQSMNGWPSQEVVMPVTEYMKLLGLKDTTANQKDAMQKLREAMEVLSSVRLKYSGHGYNYMNLSIYGGFSGMVNKTIVFHFSRPYVEMMKLKRGFLQIPRYALQINNQCNPNSLVFVRKLAIHKAINHNKPNADRIRVKSLLEVAPSIPSYSEQKCIGKVRQRIIDPFIRDMDALWPCLDPSYYNPNGKTITPEEIAKISYPEFKMLTVEVSWKRYPGRQRKNEIVMQMDSDQGWNG
jgi:hypothetical protein